MSLILLFLLLLLLLFGVLVYMLKPTSMEKAVEEQLASIEEVQPVGGGGASATILKERVAGSTMVEQLAQKLPWSHAASRLIKQGGRDHRILFGNTVVLHQLVANPHAAWIGVCAKNLQDAHGALNCLELVGFYMRRVLRRLR